MRAEDFLMKYGICSDTTIGIEGDIKLVNLLEEYANLYHPTQANPDNKL